MIYSTEAHDGPMASAVAALGGGGCQYRVAAGTHRGPQTSASHSPAFGDTAQ